MVRGALTGINGNNTITWSQERRSKRPCLRPWRRTNPYVKCEEKLTGMLTNSYQQADLWNILEHFPGRYYLHNLAPGLGFAGDLQARCSSDFRF